MTTVYEESEVVKCQQCLGMLVDDGNEVICTSCGMVQVGVESVEKFDATLYGTTHSPGRYQRAKAITYTKYSLGSLLGSQEQRDAEEPKMNEISGLAEGMSEYRYLKKQISDIAFVKDEREHGWGISECFSEIERLCDKLSIPDGIVGQAVEIAQHLFKIRKERKGYTIFAIAAFSVARACKIFRVPGIDTKTIMEESAALGHKISKSKMLKMGFDCPQQAEPMSAEDYLGRIVAQLTSPKLVADGEPAGYRNNLFIIARMILKRLGPAARGGRNPAGMAATAVYAVEFMFAGKKFWDMRFSQQHVATCAGCAEYTIRDQFCKIFRPRLDKICQEIAPNVVPESEK